MVVTSKATVVCIRSLSLCFLVRLLTFLIFFLVSVPTLLVPQSEYVSVLCVKFSSRHFPPLHGMQAGMGQEDTEDTSRTEAEATNRAAAVASTEAMEDISKADMEVQAGTISSQQPSMSLHSVCVEVLGGDLLCEGQQLSASLHGTRCHWHDSRRARASSCIHAYHWNRAH